MHTGEHTRWREKNVTTRREEEKGKEDCQAVVQLIRGAYLAI